MRYQERASVLVDMPKREGKAGHDVDKPLAIGTVAAHTISLIGHSPEPESYATLKCLQVI